MTRRILPQRRASETFDLRFWSQNFTVTIGRYPDGTLGEVFIDGGKTGQDVQSTARDAAVVLSSPCSTAPPSRRSGTPSRATAPVRRIDPRRDRRCAAGNGTRRGMIHDHMNIWLLRPGVGGFGNLPTLLDDTDKRGGAEQFGERWRPIERAVAVRRLGATRWRPRL